MFWLAVLGPGEVHSAISRSIVQVTSSSCPSCLHNMNNMASCREMLSAAVPSMGLSMSSNAEMLTVDGKLMYHVIFKA